MFADKYRNILIGVDLRVIPIFLLALSCFYIFYPSTIFSQNSPFFPLHIWPHISQLIQELAFSMGWCLSDEWTGSRMKEIHLWQKNRLSKNMWHSLLLHYLLLWNFLTGRAVLLKIKVPSVGMGIINAAKSRTPTRLRSSSWYWSYAMRAFLTIWQLVRQTARVTHHCQYQYE